MTEYWWILIPFVLLNLFLIKYWLEDRKFSGGNGPIIFLVLLDFVAYSPFRPKTCDLTGVVCQKADCL